MYTPNHYKLTDQTEIISFMRAYSFATIVTTYKNRQTATHLPFAVTEKEGTVYIHSHFAKANEQSKEACENDALVIFTEPHAYISTKNYDHEKNVPTWNYMAVHVYGKVEIITEKEEIFKELDLMIDFFEKEYKMQWDSLPTLYREGMAKAIVPFRIRVNEIQAKKKISQNRTATERERIIATLEKENNTAANAIADMMKKENKEH